MSDKIKAAVRVSTEMLTFAETAGAGTYSATVDLPPGAWLLDVQVQGDAPWNAATSASLDVGDAADPDGFYAGVNLKALDLLAGETLSFAKSGGKEGAYITATHVLKRHSAAARAITAKVVTVGGAGTTGRTRVLVEYVDPALTTAVLKA